MEVKKSPKADLEGKKTTWLLVGFVLILAAMFVAFEWTERDKQVTTDTGITEPIFEEEMIPITEHTRFCIPPEISPGYFLLLLKLRKWKKFFRLQKMMQT